MSVITLTSENFTAEVLDSPQTALVDFWAEWCGPCRMYAPIIEQVAAERPDVKVCKVNADEQPELASRYQVMSLPTTLVFRGGKVARSAVGARPKAAVLGLLD